MCYLEKYPVFKKMFSKHQGGDGLLNQCQLVSACLLAYEMPTGQCMPVGVCNVQVKIPQHMQNLTALKMVGAEGCSFPDFTGLTSNTHKREWRANVPHPLYGNRRPWKAFIRLDAEVAHTFNACTQEVETGRS